MLVGDSCFVHGGRGWVAVGLAFVLCCAHHLFFIFTYCAQHWWLWSSFPCPLNTFVASSMTIAHVHWQPFHPLVGSIHKDVRSHADSFHRLLWFLLLRTDWSILGMLPTSMSNFFHTLSSLFATNPCSPSSQFASSDHFFTVVLPLSGVFIFCGSVWKGCSGKSILEIGTWLSAMIEHPCFPNVTEEMGSQSHVMLPN